MTAPAVDPDLLRRAREPRIVVGQGILEAELAALGAYLLISQPGPLEAAPAALAGRAVAVHHVTSLAEEELDALDRTLPAAPVIVGLGGGMTLDTAKWLAWRRGVRLVLAPSIVSVDACVTNAAAVRAGGSVVYRGFVVADPIVVDTALVRAAPTRLNRAGIGDLLSIHTALWDWREGESHGGARFEPVLAGRSEAVLRSIEGLADEIAAVTPVAVEAVVRAYAQVNALCLDAGHAQPEEGSEHYLAYRVEALTGRSFVHGELVGLGIVLMAALQGNEAWRPAGVLDRAGVGWRPADLELERDLLVEALGSLPAFVREQGLPWSVIDAVPDLRERAPALLAGLPPPAGPL